MSGHLSRGRGDILWLELPKGGIWGVQLVGPRDLRKHPALEGDPLAPLPAPRSSDLSGKTLLKSSRRNPTFSVLPSTSQMTFSDPAWGSDDGVGLSVLWVTES